MNRIWFNIPLTNNTQFKKIRTVGENNIGSSKMRNPNFCNIILLPVVLSCSKGGKRARTIIGGAITIWGAI